jgi:hypothetical protein
LALKAESIIQIDSTIIAGALVLLSVSSVLPIYEPRVTEGLGSSGILGTATESLVIAQSQETQADFRLLISKLTLGVITPLIGSAIFCLIGRERPALYAMAGGLGMIILTLALITYFNQLDLESKNRLVQAREKQWNDTLAEFDKQALLMLDSNQTGLLGTALNDSLAPSLNQSGKFGVELQELLTSSLNQSGGLKNITNTN